MRFARVITAAAAVAVIALPALAGNETSSSGDLQRFGTPITVSKPVDVKKLEKRPAKFVGQTVRLEGVVASVCQGRGCWVEVRGARGGSFLAKSLDHSLLLPKDCKGWKVVVQGKVVALPQEGHDHGHKHGDGHDHSHGDEGEAAHECPQPEYVVSSEGIELVAAAK